MNIGEIISALITLSASVLSMAQSTESKCTPEEFGEKIKEEMDARDFLIANAHAAEKKLMDG